VPAYRRSAYPPGPLEDPLLRRTHQGQDIRRELGGTWYGLQNRFVPFALAPDEWWKTTIAVRANERGRNWAQFEGNLRNSAIWRCFSP